MNKPTPGTWRVYASYIHTENGNICAMSDPRKLQIIDYAPVAIGSPNYGEVSANAALIVAAVNACFSVNAENPMAVAERIPEAVAALREAKRYFYQRPGNWEQQLFDTITAALAKLESR